LVTPAKRSDRRARAVAVALAGTAAIVFVLLLARHPPSTGSPRATFPTTSTPSSETGLTPATHGVGGSVGPASPGSTNGDTPVPSVVLVGAGDIADCDSNRDEATARLLDDIPGTVFTLGDNAYEQGSPREFRQCYDPTWGRQLERTKPVVGNHEYFTPGASGYFGYFGEAAGDPGTGWYAYDAGTWRVYALNGNCALIGGCDAGSPQVRWLRRDLASNPRACVLAMWHQPRFSSGMHGNDAETQGLWQALYDAGAELVLNGHDHDYERFAPQTATGDADADRGLVEIVVGTGGRSFYEFETIRANSLIRNNSTHGVLRLTLSAGSWSFQFVPVSGESFTDAGSGPCH
jgi:acid phosphatase type 7